MRGDKFLTAAVAIVLLSNLLFDLMLLLDTSPFVFLDLKMQSRLCAYTLHGIDPYPQIGVEPPLLPEVGSIMKDFGTSPWGLILGNIFYPAFLPLELAEIYFVALNIALMSTTAFLVWNASRKISARLAVISITLFILPAGLMRTIWWGNAGGCIICLLIICCVICDRRPILTGVLLSLAMIKPQVALTFCILFLLQRRFKVVLTAAAIDIGAWLIASALTGTAPITLLSEMFEANIGGGSHFSGFLILFFAADPMQSIYASMAVGTVLIIFLHCCSTERSFLSMYPACVAASIWSYSTGNEDFILTLPALLCFHIMLGLDDNFDRLKWFWGGIFLYSSLMVLQTCIIGSRLFSINQAFGLSYKEFVRLIAVLRVSFCFVFIEMALCINRRLKRGLDRAAD